MGYSQALELLNHSEFHLTAQLHDAFYKVPQPALMFPDPRLSQQDYADCIKPSWLSQGLTTVVLTVENPFYTGRYHNTADFPLSSFPDL